MKKPYIYYLDMVLIAIHHSVIGSTTDYGCHVTKTDLQINLNLLNIIRVYWYLNLKKRALLVFVFIHNSLIIHDIIQQVVFSYFNLYILPFITIKSDMETAQKVFN